MKNFDNQWQIQGGGGYQRRAPPLGPNFFSFMQFLANIWQNNRLAPRPRELVPRGKSWIRHG